MSVLTTADWIVIGLYFQVLEKQLRKVYESPVTGSIRAMLLESIGMTWLPLSVVAEDLSAGRLVCPEGDHLTGEIKVVIYRRSESCGPVLEKFWRHVAAQKIATQP